MMENIKITDVRVHPGDSAFLIDDGNVAILYDSGFAFTGYAVAEKIKNILGNRSLDYIFLTHSHYDHAAGSPYVLRTFPDAEVVAGEYAAKIFAKNTAKDVMRELDGKIAKRSQVFEYEDLIDELRVDIQVSDGDVIKAKDLEFEVLYLPGHTRCSVGFYCRKSKLLLACETVGVYNGQDDVVPSYLVGYDMTISSIERVRKLDAENILVPHFGLLSGKDARFYLERAYDSAINTAKEITDMIKSGKSDEAIADFFENRFYHGYIKDIYPPDAMKLNTKIMIGLLKREALD
jgi:glyoxylase-like metal-dependent hydrolase (beta-lactamase superfamily II)